ncbi:MAG: hypothetical protein SPH45_01860 [Gemmiger qucibialis]|nr:hypothetical protein [Gemmiger qucibialis]
MRPYNHDIYLNGYKAVTFEGPLRLGTYDSYGNERIRVLCSPEWDGLTIVATFKAANAVEVLVDADGMLDVPPEATATQQAAAGRCALTFVGTGEGRQTISCTTYYLVQDHATVGNVTPDPTPDKWQQFVDQVAADRTGAAAAAKEAARSAQDAKTAESNAKDSADNAADSATAAAESAQAAAESAEAAARSATNAQGSADAAAKSAETAKTAETGAGSNAAAAKNSADRASASAAAANESQTAAKASQDAANESQTAAKASQDAASASASTASSKATAAGNSAAAAATSEKNAAASSASAKTAQSAAETAKTGAESAKTAADSSAKAAASSASAAIGAASTATTQATAAKSSADNAASSATAAKSSETAAARSAQGATNAETAAKAAQSDAETAKTGADTAASNASEKATAAASSAAAAKSSETAAAKSADDAKNYAAQVAGIVTSQAIFGVNFSGSASAGTRVGAAKDFVFAPGTDTSAGQNSFDAVYPWAGMRRCCCTLNADGTVKVNAYKGQPGYIEDGTNGEVLVEIPLFYVSGMLDVAPSISMSMLPGYRAPRKFLNADGSLKQKCYVRAFPGSIGADGKLHSIAGAVPTGNQNITRFLTAARKWGDTYSIGTSADFEVLAYLMVVVYGTRNLQGKINGCVSLHGTNIAVAAATDNAASVVVAKNAGIEPGMVISIGTGGESETIARRRIVTSVEAIDGDTANIKVNFDGDPVTTTTDHKIWRIMQGTGTANSVITTCGSPVSNTDGRHSFVFYGVENPLYGNQWRFECDWKLIDGVPYWCDEPTKYSWTSNDGYIALDTMAMPDEGWATALQQDDRAPSVQITKSVGGSSGTYLADYFWINKTGTRVALRGGASNRGGDAGPFYLTLNNGAGAAWWHSGGDLSIPG